ncbi:MAG: hypothetical protein ACRC5C_13585, partial [Bacilli bacterium]
MIDDLTEEISETRRLTTSNKVKVVGWNAENQQLVMSRRFEYTDGLKSVTESGLRNTSVALSQRIIEDMAGKQGTEAIFSRLGEGKRATDLPSLIRGGDTYIRKEFAGAFGVSLGDQAAMEKKLDLYYDGVSEHFGIDRDLIKKRTDNGSLQYTVDSFLGASGEYHKEIQTDKGPKTIGFTNEQRQQFETFQKEFLGLDYNVYSEIVQGHDVYRNHGVMGRGSYGAKELEIYWRKAQLLGGMESPEDSHYFQYKMEQMTQKTDTGGYEHKLKAQINSQKTRAGKTYWAPKDGDMVFDFTADSHMWTQDGINAIDMKLSDMQEGLEGRAIFVKGSEIQKAPENNGSKYTMRDYIATGADIGSVQIKMGQASEQLKRARELTSDASMFYMRINNTIEGFEGLPEYLPMFDINNILDNTSALSKDRVAVLDELQNSMNSLVRNYREATNATDLTEDQIKTARNNFRLSAESHLEKISNITGKDGFKDAFGLRMEKAAMYQSGGVNPFLAYEKVNENGREMWKARQGLYETAEYMNSADVSKQIKGLEANIIASWGENIEDLKKIDGFDAHRYVLDNINEKGMYGDTIRFPSIDTGTQQVKKIMIDDSVAVGQTKSMRGSSERQSEDYDGDGKVISLDHYNIKDAERRSLVLNEMKAMHKEDHKMNELFGDMVLKKMESDITDNIRSGVQASGKFEKEQIAEIEEATLLAKQQFMYEIGAVGEKPETVGSFTMSEISQFVGDDYKGTSWGTFEAGFGDSSYMVESRMRAAEKLAVFGTVGSADNLRMQITAGFGAYAQMKFDYANMGNAAYEYSQETMSRNVASVQEFLREVSQKSISAKKGGQQLSPKESIENIYNMLDRIRNIDAEKDFAGLADEMLGRGLFKDDIILEATSEQRFTTTPQPTANGGQTRTKRDFLIETLQLIKEADQNMS